MQASFWHQKWSKNEIGFDQAKVNPLLATHFKKLNLKTNATVFVPLCGKSIDMVWLMEQGMNVVGVELSEDAIVQFFTALDVKPEISSIDQFKCYKAANITVFVGDFFALRNRHIGSIDATYDRASLVALPLAMRIDYCRHLSAITDQAAQLVVTFQYDQTQQSGPPFAISAAEIERHYSSQYKPELLASKPVKGGLKGGCEALEELRLMTAI